MLRKLAIAGIALALGACSGVPGFAANRPRVPNPCTTMPDAALTAFLGSHKAGAYKQSVDVEKDYKILERDCSWTDSASEQTLFVTAEEHSDATRSFMQGRWSSQHDMVQGQQFMTFPKLGQGAWVISGVDEIHSTLGAVLYGTTIITFFTNPPDGRQRSAEELHAVMEAFVGALPRVSGNPAPACVNSMCEEPGP